MQSSTFKDLNGKAWNLRLDGPLIKELRKLLEFDIVADNAFPKLDADPVLLIDTLFLLCRGQSEGLKEEDFCVAIGDGDVLEAAAKALEVAYLNFSPPRKRSLLSSLRNEQDSMLEEGIELAKTKVTNPELRKSLMAKLEADIDQALAAVLTGPTPATSSPATSVSTPPASPPASSGN